MRVSLVSLVGAVLAANIMGICLVPGVLADSWWDSDWKSRKQINFTSWAGSGTANLTDFTLMVKLNSSYINYSKCKSDGSDLRFIDRDGSALGYHIEEWNSSGDSFVWVKVPLLDNTGADYIWIYYNNAGASDAQNEANTYDGGYVGVWHLDGTSPELVDDSSSNNNDGTFNGSALEFDGDDFVRVPSSEGLNATNEVTVETWVDGVESSGSAWAKTFGETSDDRFRNIKPTSDGGYIAVGDYNIDGDYDNIIIKTDAEGNQEWAKNVHNNYVWRFFQVEQTSDGGYITSAMTGPGSSGDIMIIKLDSTGDIQWSKNFSASSQDAPFDIIQTSDEGYIVTGNSYWNDESETLLMKLDSNGNSEWNKTYKVSNCDSGSAVEETSDGGYIVAGYTSCGDRNITVFKLDSSGSVEWAKMYSDPDQFNTESAYSIKQTSDQGYIVYGSQEENIVLLKLDSSGNQEWARTFLRYTETSPRGFSDHIVLTSDGKYVVCSNAYQHSTQPYYMNIILFKVDASGNIEQAEELKNNWTSGYDYCYAIHPTSDGGYIIGADTSSHGSGPSGYWDGLLLKVDANMRGVRDFISVDLTTNTYTFNVDSVSPTTTSRSFSLSSPSVSTQSVTPTTSTVFRDGAGIAYKSGSYGIQQNATHIVGFINNYTVSAPVQNGWHRVALTYDKSYNMTLFVDGTAKDSKALSESINANTNDLLIGNVFNGSIDEVRVYNRSLSTLEVAERYRGNFSDETGLVGLWHFDEGTGQTAGDDSGEGNDGTLGGDGLGTDLPSWSNATRRIDGRGKLDGADVFNGVDDGISMGTPSSLNVTTPFSVGAWVNTKVACDSSTTTRREIVKGIDTWVLRCDERSDADFASPGNSFSPGLHFEVRSASNGSYYVANGSISANEWHFVMGVHDGTYIKLYIDGSLARSVNIGADASSGSFEFSIGRHPTSANYWNGTIDDVRISNVSRSAAWINASYLSETGALVSYGSEEQLSIQFRIFVKLTLNGTGNSVYIPGTGVLGADELGSQTFGSPAYYFLASYGSNVLYGLVRAYGEGDLLVVSNTSANHSMTLKTGIDDSNILLVFTEGDWKNVWSQLTLLEAGTFFTYPSPTFAYGLGKVSDIFMVMSYSFVDLLDTAIYHQGGMKLYVQNVNDTSGKVVINVTR